MDATIRKIEDIMLLVQNHEDELRASEMKEKALCISTEEISDLTGIPVEQVTEYIR